MGNKITLYHGSNMIVRNPEFGKGNSRNDYGLGFYCTKDPDLAKEWACGSRAGGYSNIYNLEISALEILDLSSEAYGILNWLAALIDNRTFLISNPIAAEAKEYLTAWFLPNFNAVDVVVGNRADDSYFTFALDFLNNTISVRQLKRAMALGSLGKQFVLKSRKAFDQIQFVRSEPADGDIYFEKRRKRDAEARKEYLQNERNMANMNDDIYMIDILRQEMKQNDARL